MAVVNWSVVWLRINYILLLVPGALASLYLKLIGVFCHSEFKQDKMDIPLSVTSYSPASDVHLAYPFPTVTKDSRHVVASRWRLRHGARLGTTVLGVPGLCETPLLPFQSVPSSEGGRGQDAPAMTETLHEHGDSISLASLPSFSLHTPLSTSNALYTASPFIYHGDALSTPSDYDSLFSPPWNRDSLDAVAANQFHGSRDLTRSSCVFQNNTGENSAAYSGHFCGCREPCSNHVSMSPALGSFDLGGLQRTSLSTIPSTTTNRSTRQHSFDVNPSADTLAWTWRGHLTEGPRLSNPDLTTPDPASGSWRRNLWSPKSRAPMEPILELDTQKVVAESPLCFRRSEVYDAWVSSWCFRPAAPGALNVVAPSDLLCSSPQSGPFLPPCTSSPKGSIVQGQAIKASPACEVKLDGLGFLPAPSSMLSRNSQVASATDKLRDLRELLEILDEAITGSGVTSVPLDWEDGGPEWTTESEVAIAGLAL